MARKEPEIDLKECLEERFERWDRLKTEGGSDPFWADGSNMNMVRAQIKYYKGKIEKKFSDGNYPEIYYRETPPKTDTKYMAQPDKIRADAQKALETFKADENLNYLKKRYIGLDEKFAKQIYISAVLGYERALENAIADDDLVAMRRFGNNDIYLQLFESCTDKVRKYKPPENSQLSIFDIDTDDEAMFEITM